MDERRLEIKVGVLVLAALAGVLGLLWLMGELQLGRGAALAVEFSHSGNVVAGAPVKMGGVPVGRVERLVLTPDRRDADGEPLPVKMELAIEPAAKAVLREDAQVTIATQGPLGEPYLEVYAGTSQAMLTREPLRGMDPLRLDVLANRLSSLFDSVSRLLEDDPKALSSLVGGVTGLSRTLDGVLKDNREELRGLVGELSLAVKDVRQVAHLARGQLEPGGKGAQLIDDAAASAKALRQDLPAITADAKKAMDGVANVSGALTVEDGQRLRVAIARYSSAGERLDRIAARAENILVKMEAGEGTLGGLYKDPQVYQDLKALVTEVKKHPWKILWKD